MNNKTTALIVLAAVCGFAAIPAQAGPHHDPYYHHSNGVRLATDIVNLVKTVVTPPVVIHEAPVQVVQPQVVQPTVVQPAVVAPGVPVVVPAAPTVIQAPPVVEVTPSYTYRYYNGALVPYYENWYYVDNTWNWVGRGPRPAPPTWRPHHNPNFRGAVPPPHRPNDFGPGHPGGGPRGGKGGPHGGFGGHHGGRR